MSPIESTRSFLDNWKVWMLIAYLALAGCVVALYFAFNRQADISAERAAERKSQNAQQVTACRQAVVNSPRFLTLLGLIQDLTVSTITANEEALKIRAPDDPLRKVSEGSLSRIRPKLPVLAAAIAETAEQAPTVAQCNGLARRLGISPLQEPNPTKRGTVPTQTTKEQK